MTGEIEDLVNDQAEQSNFVGKVANSKLIKGFRNSGFNKGLEKPTLEQIVLFV